MQRLKKLLPFVAATTSALFVLVLVLLLDLHEGRHFRRQQREDVLHEVNGLRGRIEQSIAVRAAMIRGLAAFVISNPGLAQDDFERFLQVLVDHDGGLRYVTLVQNQSVTHVYPFAGNEHSIGIRPLDAPEQREAIGRMLAGWRTVLSGPVDLPQGGGRGFVLRTPIRRPGEKPRNPAGTETGTGGQGDSAKGTEDDSAGPRKKTATSMKEKPGAGDSSITSEGTGDWAAVVLDPELIFAEAGLLDAGQHGLVIALRGNDGTGTGTKVLLGDEAMFSGDEDVESVEVAIPGGYWQLACKPVEGWGAQPELAWRLRAGGSLLALLAALLAYVLVSNPQRLREAAELALSRLKESELRYSDLIHNAQEGIYQTTPGGRYLSANPALARIHGYDSPEDLVASPTPVGNRYRDPMRREEFRREIELRGAVSNFESQIVRRDGELVWVRENARAVRGADGAVAYYEGTMVDITATRQAEAALSISQMELQIKADSLAIINSISNQLYRNLDLQGVIERTLAAFSSYLQADAIALFSINLEADELQLQAHRGLSEELVKLSSSLPLQGSLTGIAVRRREVVAVEDVVMDERTIPQARGALDTMRLRSVCIVPLIYEDQVQGVLNVAWRELRGVSPHEQDTLIAIGKTVGIALHNAKQVSRIEEEVRERRRADEALSRSEARYRMVSELTSDFAYALRIEPDGRIQREWVTGAFAKITGYEAEEVDRLGWNNLVHPDDWPLIVERWEALRSLRIDIREFRIRTKKGEVVWLRDIARPVRDEALGVVRIFGAAHDISERKAAEEENAELEAQLRHTQKMDALGTLAGGVAHDFNNLLTGILGYAGLLKLGQEKGSPVFNSADVIEKAAERASALTRQMLGFARRGKLQDVPIDLHDVVQEVISFLSRSIGKNIVIHQVFRAKGRLVKGDPGQIQQVVLNLAVNARDAMPGGGELSFESEIRNVQDSELRKYDDARAGEYFVLTVTDTGQGIPPELHERIFDPFFTTKEQGKGTGMGLAMVYGIVRNHGGFIQLESAPGRGAKFRVFLPACPPGDVVQPEPEVINPVRGEGTILVIDDEEVIRDLLGDMLRTLGYEVMTAANGREGLELYAENWRRIDLVMLDMIMPEMGGRETFNELRKLNPAVRAILSTGYGKDGAAQEILDLGQIGFIQKPYRLVQISEAIAAAMKSGGHG